MDMKSAGILGGCIIVAVLLVSQVPRATTRTDPEARHIHAIDGSIVVDYVVETSPSGTEGGTMPNVSDIEFYENNVVVKDKSGHGRVFFGARTRSLGWSVGKK